MFHFKNRFIHKMLEKQVLQTFQVVLC